MTRCCVCDWTPNGPQSDYYQGVAVAAKGRNKHLLLDKKTGDTICTTCAIIVSIDIATKKEPEP